MTRNTIIKNCKKYLGRPYVWGGENMAEGGYDCSGYVYNVLKDSKMKVSRTTANGYRKLGKKISIGAKQPGDLLFFGTAAKATHIAIYAGNGKMYESIGGSKNTKSNPGKGVTLSRVSRRKDLIEVRTVVSEKTSNSTSSSDKKDDRKYTLKQFVKDVQEATGSKVDGIAGSETIKNTITVSAEANPRHRVVKSLQRRLNDLGYNCGTEDGIAGPKFTAAVNQYQEKVLHYNKTDGEITAGNRMWKSLLGM